MLTAAALVCAAVWLTPQIFPPEESETISSDVAAAPEAGSDVTPPGGTAGGDSAMTVPGEEETETPKTARREGIYLPPAGEKPLMAIIVDDAGYQIELAKRVESLGLPLTWAILPYTKYAAETAALADIKAVPYLLHLPMQAQADADGNGEYIIGRGMTTEQIRGATAKALNSLPGAIGLNNHRGSLATSSGEIMKPVIAVLKERGLMFVDSRTAKQSVAYDAAVRSGVRALRNRGFLDGSAEKSDIESRFDEAVKIASKRGSVIVICHFRPATVSFLETIARRKGSLPVRLVTIPEFARLTESGTN